MKTWYFIQAYCKANLLEDCLKHIFLNPPKDVCFVIIANHYPIHKRENLESVKSLAKWYGCIYLDTGGDLGQVGALNFALEKLQVGHEDILSGQDPDDRPQHGFVDVQREVMNLDPKIAIASLNFWVIEQRFREGKLIQKQLGNHVIWEHPSIEMFLTSAFRASLVLSSGFKANYKYYGGIESGLYAEFAKKGMKLVYLRDVKAEALSLDKENRNFFDPEYRQWKTDHIGGFKGSFEEWLVARGKADLI